MSILRFVRNLAYPGWTLTNGLQSALPNSALKTEDDLITSPIKVHPTRENCKKKAGTLSLLTRSLPVCRGLEADRQEAITQLPDTPSDAAIMRADFHSLAIDYTCVSLDFDFSCRLNFYMKSKLKRKFCFHDYRILGQRYPCWSDVKQTLALLENFPRLSFSPPFKRKRYQWGLIPNSFFNKTFVLFYNHVANIESFFETPTNL